jgi:hypothetical protein
MLFSHEIGPHLLSYDEDLEALHFDINANLEPEEYREVMAVQVRFYDENPDLVKRLVYVICSDFQLTPDLRKAVRNDPLQLIGWQFAVLGTNSVTRMFLKIITRLKGVDSVLFAKERSEVTEWAEGMKA